MFKKLLGMTAMLGLVASFGITPSVAQDAANQAEPERECKTAPIVRTGGRARTMLFARKKARDAWRQKVARRFGKEWTAWPYANKAEYNCRKSKGRRLCTISAIPCKLKVVIHGPHKVCAFYLINGTGPKAKLKEWAKHKARKVWAERVKGFYGTKYDTWLISNNKNTTCKDFDDGTHSCTASAKPCRFHLVK